jgi:hypothetical protein
VAVRGVIEPVIPRRARDGASKFIPGHATRVPE